MLKKNEIKVIKNLPGGVTREVLLGENNGQKVVIKNYKTRIMPTFVDLSKSTFSLFFALNSVFPKISFSSRKQRIKREIRARKDLEKLGIMSPHLLGHSFKKNYLIEEFIEGQNLFDLIKKSDGDMRKALSYQVGKLTGFIHSKNYSFFDNRPQNYIMNSNKIFRTDLETFVEKTSEFEKTCDIISFTESFNGDTRKEVYENFLKGYSSYSQYHPNSFLELFARKVLVILNSNISRSRISSLIQKHSVRLNRNSLHSVKHLLARNKGPSETD